MMVSSIKVYQSRHFLMGKIFALTLYPITIKLLGQFIHLDKFMTSQYFMRVTRYQARKIELIQEDKYLRISSLYLIAFSLIINQLLRLTRRVISEYLVLSFQQLQVTTFSFDQSTEIYQLSIFPLFQAYTNILGHVDIM